MKHNKRFWIPMVVFFGLMIWLTVIFWRGGADRSGVASLLFFAGIGFLIALLAAKNKDALEKRMDSNSKEAKEARAREARNAWLLEHHQELDAIPYIETDGLYPLEDNKEHPFTRAPDNISYKR